MTVDDLEGTPVQEIMEKFGVRTSLDAQVFRAWSSKYKSAHEHKEAILRTLRRDIEMNSRLTKAAKKRRTMEAQGQALGVIGRSTTSERRAVMDYLVRNAIIGRGSHGS